MSYFVFGIFVILINFVVLVVILFGGEGVVLREPAMHSSSVYFKKFGVG
jgi:hypothetical protein